MSTCSVSGCDTKARTNGLCNKHALRLRNTGTTDPGPKAKAPISERIHAHYEKRGPNDCWLWLGDLNAQGYGRISIGAKKLGSALAHRVMWSVAKGRSIPRGKVVMHTCDTPACVNPKHLQLGTQAQNMRDMLAKQRGAPAPWYGGEGHHSARFSVDDVRAIRASTETTKVLAARYRVNQASINKVRSRKTWKHID